MKKYLGYGALGGTGLFILAYLMGSLSAETRQLIGWLGFLLSLLMIALLVRTMYVRRNDPRPTDQKELQRFRQMRKRASQFLAIWTAQLCLFFWAATVSQKNYESVVVALAVIGISAVLLYGAHSIFIPKKKADKK